jgi:MFS family permease
VARVRPVAARRAVDLVFFATGFGTGIWASQIPRIKVWLALSDAGVSAIVLSFALGAILTMPLIGALTTRLGAARTVIATGLAAALSLALLGAAETYGWLLVTALLTGIGIGGLDVAMNTQATVVERAWGSPIMSGIHGWFSLGGLAGAAAGGVLTAAAMSFRNVLFIAAAMALLSVVVAARWLAVAGVPAGGPGLAWPRRAMLGIGILCLLAFFLEGAALDWTAIYMHDTAGASLGFASAGYAGFSLSMAATRFVGDGFTRRFGPVLVLGAGAGFAAAGIALACALPTPIAVTLGMTVAGFGQANIVPLLFSAAGRVPGVAAGAGVAMAATMGYSAFLLGPPLIGFVADWVGLRSALLLVAAGAVAIACGARTVAPR